MEQNTVDLTFHETDNANTCLWKAMYGKNWMTTKEILKALENCQYKPNTIKVKLSKAIPHMVERKGEPHSMNQLGHIGCLFRLVKDTPMPTGSTRTTEKQREVKRETFQRFNPFGMPI